jgi:hypothetical protein
LVAELEDWVTGHPETAAGELAAELRRSSDERLREEFTALAEEIEVEVAAGVAELGRRHAARVERLLEDLEIGEALDATLIVEHLRQTGLREPSRFSFKLEDPGDMLGSLLGRLRLSVPGAGRPPTGPCRGETPPRRNGRSARRPPALGAP